MGNLGDDHIVEHLSIPGENEKKIEYSSHRYQEMKLNRHKRYNYYMKQNIGC